MLQLRTTINGVYKYLDTYSDEPVLLNMSFAELNDITVKNSAFTKTFTLPGSKKNNEIFNFYYDINSVPTTFNPNNKFATIVTWQGYELLQGYIRLDSVSINNGEIIYQVTFYNQIGNLAANIGDKFLVELDLSDLDHPYNDDVILQSNLDYNLISLTGSTNYPYQNGKTMWGLFNIGYEYLSGTTLNKNVTPLIQFTPTLSGSSYSPESGYFDYSGTPVHDYYFKPSIQVKELYTRIVNEAGYKIESNFFDTAYFERYYLPMKFLDETIYSRNSIVPCYTFSNSDITLFADPFGLTLNPSSGVTCNTLGYTATTTNILTPEQYTGTFTWRFTFSVTPTLPCGGGNAPYLYLIFSDTVGANDVIYYNTFCENGETTVSINQDFIITGASSLAFILVGDSVKVKNFTAEIVNSPRFIPQGSNINYGLEFPPNDYKQIDFIQSINRFFNLVVVPSPEKPDYLIVEPIVDYIGKGRTLDWTTKIDYSQTQQIVPTTTLINGTLNFNFLLDRDYANQDFNKQSNRVFGTQKVNLNLEYKNSTTDFNSMFASPIDITINNVFSPQITVSSMSNVRTLDQNGQSIQTFVPFKILPKLIFRGLTLPVDNYGFIGGSGETTGSIFCTSGITINVTDAGWIKYEDCFQNINYQYVPVGSKTFTDCLNASTFLQGFPYIDTAAFTITSSGTTCGTVQRPPVYQIWFMDDVPQDRFTNLNRYTTYPFSYTGFSHYINYRGEDTTTITPAEYTFISEDLYDIYYKPYIDDLISEENKIYSCKIYLYPEDIQGLYWNEKILINNTYFRINKISNFNLNEPSICDIELVKLTKDYEPHRVLYYELLPCAGGTILYSNSDLMYNLYAYAGNYVKLYDDGLNYLGCYGVNIDGYNETYNYQHFYIGTGYTQNLVNVYPDCGCSGRTEFLLVQETSEDIRYFNYVGTGCSTSQLYYFVSDNPNLLSGTTAYRIENGITSVCVNNVRPSFLQQTDWIEAEEFADCASCELLPTPTNTPTPSQTPNPTPTPTGTPAVTPTPTGTPDTIFDAYLANVYSCIDCSVVATNVLVSFPTGTPVTIGFFYNDEFVSGNVYQITSTTFGATSTVCILPGSSTCNIACSI